MFTRRRRITVALSLAAFAVSIPGSVAAGAGIDAAKARPAPGVQHRVVARPDVPETAGVPGRASGHRVVAEPARPAKARAAVAGTGSTSFAYTSEPGDYIGQGAAHTYT